MNLVPDKMNWYFNRLAAMSPPEVAHRIAEVVKRVGGRRFGGWEKFSLPPGRLPHLPIDNLRFAKAAPALESEWTAFWHIAQQGRWQFLGQAWPAIDTHEGLPKMVWHLDPVTGRHWPTADYCFDIPFRHAPGFGDVKYVWELNRLQFLPPLAALSRYRSDEIIRNWCFLCIESWIDANPPFSGVNWTSGIELAIRVVSLILTVSLLGPDTIPVPLADKIRTTLNAHAMWLARYPSRFSSANNHLISEAAALYILGAMMPDLPHAARYLEYGFRTLTSEALKQILADGVGAEQSPTYTAFALEWYLIALTVADVHRDTFPTSVMDRLHQAAIHLRWLTDDGGAQPRIGDDDEGRVIGSGPTLETGYVSAIMSSLSAATQDPTVAPPITKTHLREVFLGASTACPKSPMGWHTFDTGGYTVHRQTIAGRQTMLTLDHGQLGYLSLAAHGHADALSIWIHIDDQPVLIDAGTYLYHSGGTARNYFRGTSAHNTLTLDDQDQSRISGPFNWSNKANAWRLPTRQIDGGDDVVARHDGYQKRFGVIHQRGISVQANNFAITDTLVGTLVRPGIMARLRYVLSPNLGATQSANNRIDLTLGDLPLASIQIILSPGRVSPRVQLAGMDISPRFGVRFSGKCILAECPAADLISMQFRTLIKIIEK